MRVKNILINGTMSGLMMGVFLFIGGAIFSRIIYGPQFVPPGKFKPEQINPFYFIWTKLLIGWCFGILFTFAYEMLPLRTKITGVLQGLIHGFMFWLLICLWGWSHPLVYGPINVSDQMFWSLYQLVGFLGFGATLGYIYKRRTRNELLPSIE